MKSFSKSALIVGAWLWLAVCSQAAQNPVNVLVNTNGTLRFPMNLFAANSNLLNAAIGAGPGNVTASNTLTNLAPLLGGGAKTIYATNSAGFRAAVGVVIGTDVQAYDADLDDLADGSLTGSKVGTGVDGGNISAGTIADARIASTITRDTEWDTIAEIEATTGVNILVTTELDTLAKLNTLIGDADVQQAFTTGAGVTNISNVVSGNYTAGSNITLTTNANGVVSIAVSAGSTNYASLTITNNVNRALLTPTGALIDVSCDGPSVIYHTLTQNTIFALVDPPASTALERFIKITVTGNGVNTVGFGFTGGTIVWISTQLATPGNGSVVDYEFAIRGSTAYASVCCPPIYIENVPGLQATLDDKQVAGASIGFAQATSLTITGTAGEGFIEHPSQSSPPSAPSSGYRDYANIIGRKTWMTAGGFAHTFASALTGDRIYTLPDASITVGSAFTTGAGVTNISNVLSGNYTAGANITLTTNENGAVAIAGSAGGAGDVVGPASATDNAIARFDGTTGKLVQNSAASIADTTGALTLGDGTQATTTISANLSGATDPSLSFENAAISSSTRLHTGPITSALAALSTTANLSSSAGATSFAAENTTASSATQGSSVSLYSNDGAAMASGDRLGLFLFGGSSSASSLRNSASVTAFASQAWVDASAYGSRLAFDTTANGATTRTERMSIGQDGRLTLNAGTPLLKILSATATLNFGSILAASSADLTITVTGAAVGDSASFGLPAAPDTTTVFNAFVSAADTVTIRCFNVGTIAVDPASASYRATVHQF